MRVHWLSLILCSFYFGTLFSTNDNNNNNNFISTVDNKEYIQEM